MSPTVRRIAVRFGQVAITFACYAFFNAIAVNFEIENGISILFPATAVAIVACMQCGIWGALGVILGTMATPWGSNADFEGLFISGAISAMEGLIPWAVFRLRRDLNSDLRDMKSLLVFLLFGTVLNNAFSAIAGNLFIVSHPQGGGIHWHEVWVWWLADFTAALLLATPALAFGSAFISRFRNDAAEQRPRTIVNTLQIITVISLLGFATSFAIRTTLLNNLERARFAQQTSWARATELVDRMHANFLRAGMMPTATPEQLAEAGRANAQYVRELTPLMRTPELDASFAQVARGATSWFIDASHGVRGARGIGREIMGLRLLMDRANVKAWSDFAVKRRKIMTVALCVDGLVFLILVMSAATLLVNISRPFAQIRGAVAAMREGDEVDASRIDSRYLEFRAIGETLEETSRELRRREEALRVETERAIAASKHKSDFLAKMSHELRTPLNSIIGFSDLLMEQEETIDSRKRTSFLQNVSGSATHLLSLINDLLDISKVEAGKMTMHFEKVDLRVAIQNTVASTAPLFGRKKQNVEVVMPSEPMIVRADVSRVEQVLLNLLSNANKFSPVGDKITIRSAPADAERWRIEVADHGIGISREDQKRIFDEFEQVHSHRVAGPNAASGTGLGLALARHLIEAHGGEIDVESRVGAGSVFRVTLPRADVR